MRYAKTGLCTTLAVLLAVLCLLPLTGCGRHTHSGELLSLNVDDPADLPCSGVFRCAACGETYEDEVTYANTGLPVVRVEGSLEGISKTDKVTVQIRYDGENAFTCGATLKWQGDSTLQFNKKNYSVKFTDANGSGKKMRVKEVWGAQSKYCLKANWGDWCGARNLVSAALWGEIVHSRGKTDEFTPLVNGGAVDGFPVLLYINGAYQGLYTLNTPKDKWIFGMGKGAREGLLFGEEWSDSTQLQAAIPDPADPAAVGWDVEYCSTEGNPNVGVSWLSEGMNRLIAFLLEHDGTGLREGLGAYTDVARDIDYLLFILFICGADNTGRNILWATYDGEKYVPSAYDLDNTWAMTFDGAFSEMSAAWSDGSALRDNLLFARLLDNYQEEIRARYAELRRTVLSYENVERHFRSLCETVPACVFAAEKERWPLQPDLHEDLPERIMAFYTKRCELTDKAFGCRGESE